MIALDEFEPVTEMRVTYGEKTVIENGIVLKPEHTLIAPRLGFDPKADTEYTMAMVIYFYTYTSVFLA